jgi:hypothetical protein
MKKRILFGLGAIAIIVVLTFNVSISQIGGIQNFSLSLLSSQSAEAQEGTTTCPGGSCQYTTYFNGQKMDGCSACCNSTQHPHCDALGCTCTSN